MDGQPVGQGEPQEQMMEVRPDRIEADFLKALVGIQRDEEVQVPHLFPPDHQDTKLAGKEGAFLVKVKAIRKKILPELDDAFAKRLGEYEDLSGLRTKVREKVEEQERQRIRAAENQSLIDLLLKGHPIEVPEALVEFQIQEMIRNTQRRLAVHGLTLEQTGSDPQQMHGRYRESAVKAVRTSLILEAIAQREEMQVSDEGLDNAYHRIAQQTGRGIDQVKALYKDPAALEGLKGSLIEDAVLDFLRERAKIVDKKSQ
jgi:trigger factor